MRVGLDCSMLCLPRTGIGRYVYRLIAALAAVAPEHEYRCWYNSFRLSFPRELPQVPGPSVHQVISRVPNRLLRRIWGTPLARAMPIERMVGAVDIFHATNHLAPWAQRAKLVVTMYDLSMLRGPQWHARQLVAEQSRPRLRWSLTRAARIIAISEFTRRELTELLGLDPDNIDVVSPGIGPEFHGRYPATALDAVRRRYGMPHPYVLCVATLEPRKNLPRLMTAFGRLVAQKALPHHLVLVGMRGWREAEILAVAGADHLRERVHLLGYVADGDLPLIVAGASAFAYPSLYEGFGIPPLEAMACGIPTLVSDIPPLVEAAGEAALAVSPNSVDAIQEGLRAVLLDDALRAQLSHAGPARARQFTWERAAQRTLAVYHRALGKGEGRPDPRAHAHWH